MIIGSGSIFSDLVFFGRSNNFESTGSIFMYHHYEKTTLNDVKARFPDSNEPDIEELIECSLLMCRRKSGSGCLKICSVIASWIPWR